MFDLAILSGLFFVVASLLLLPPIRKMMYIKTGKELSTGARALALIVLFVIYATISGNEIREKERVIETQKAQKIEIEKLKAETESLKYFDKNKVEILVQAQTALSKKKYQDVVSQTSRYLVSGNEQLQELNNIAKTEIAKKRKAESTEVLLDKVKATPASDLKQNKDIYQQLLNMYPDNETYRKKFTYFSEKLDEEEQARRAAKARRDGIVNQFSVWDGSHRMLEYVIENSMNDPDSYEHVKTVYKDMGDYLIVTTRYRGKNAFGVLVVGTTKAKVSLKGEIIRIIN